MAYNPAIPVTDANALPIAGSRLIGPIKSSSPVANSAITYSPGKTIGSVLAIATGLPAGTVIYSGSFRLKALYADCTTALAILVSFFDAPPTATSDNATPAYVAADLAKMVGFSSAGPTAGYAGTFQTWTANLPRITVDASGNIYVSLVANGASVFPTANALSWDFSALY